MNIAIYTEIILLNKILITNVKIPINKLYIIWKFILCGLNSGNVAIKILAKINSLFNKKVLLFVNIKYIKDKNK